MNETIITELNNIINDITQLHIPKDLNFSFSELDNARKDKQKILSKCYALKKMLTEED